MTNAYTCKEVFERLDDYLDRELTPEELALVEDHLKTCGECAGEAQFEERVLKELKTKVRRVSVPPGLLDSVLDVLKKV